MNNWTSGAYDLHIHMSPDIIKRKCSDIETAQRISEAGMKGFVIKSHYFETASRAALLQEQFPNLKIAGSLTLNLSVGGINPNAVLRFGQLGGKMLWFPTMYALAFQAYKHKHQPDADLSSFLTVCDKNGELSAETLDVLKLAAHYNMTVGVGHISSEEGLKLVWAGRELGVSQTKGY